MSVGVVGLHPGQFVLERSREDILLDRGDRCEAVWVANRIARIDKVRLTGHGADGDQVQSGLIDEVVGQMVDRICIARGDGDGLLPRIDHRQLVGIGGLHRIRHAQQWHGEIRARFRFQWARSAHAALPEKGNAVLPLCAFPIGCFGRGRRRSNIGGGRGRLAEFTTSESQALSRFISGALGLNCQYCGS